MIGIIAAMDSELEAISQHMQDVKEVKDGPILIHEGTIDGQKIVMALSGVGKVSAAMASTILCLTYKPDLLLSVGVAGGLKEEQDVLDIVFSNGTVQADFDTSAVDGDEGYGLKAKTDEKVLALAEKAAKALDYPFHEGLIATQDLFMSREEDYQKLFAHFPDSACAEMEGGAVASVAAAFGIPCLVIRSLSDVVVHHGNSMEYLTFKQIASRRSGLFIEQFCHELTEAQKSA